MKRLMLSLSLLIAPAFVYATEDVTMQTLQQDAYMVELYRNIAEFCKGHQNPKAILVAIPLDLIMASGELPKEMQDRIASITQAMAKNDAAEFDNDDAMALVVELIPYMELLDARIATSIKEMQKLGVRIIAISPFMPQHADAMLARMKKLDLDFSSTALYKKEMPIDDEAGNRVALAKNGVVFLNDYFQGMAVLQTLVENASGEIEQLIFAAPMSQGAEQTN